MHTVDDLRRIRDMEFALGCVGNENDFQREQYLPSRRREYSQPPASDVPESRVMTVLVFDLRTHRFTVEGPDYE